MFAYMLRRVFQTVPVLVGVSLLVFLFIYLIPGDPALVILGERATPEAIARVRETLGLNRPLMFNPPYTYDYQCPTDYTGPYFDLIVVMIPNTCTRNVQLKPDWAVLRVRAETSLTVVRTIIAPETRVETADLDTALRLIGVRTVEELDLQPGVPRNFPTYNGNITVTLNVTQALFSDLLDSQYFLFVGRIMRGDLGSSIQGNLSISDELARRFPATVELALYALLLATLIGVPVGILSALKRNSWIDTLSMLSALIGVSLPIFVLGLLLIYTFSVALGWLPTGQRIPSTITIQTITGLYTLDSLLTGNWTGFGTALRHLLMPALALSTIPLAIIARITRSAMLEVLHQDYIRTARAKGLRERSVTLRHALRNALLPVVTVIGLQLGALLSGAVLTETIFSWTGIGKWLFDSIEGRDYPIVQAVSLVITLVYVTINLIVDLSYAFLDPRIRYE